MKKVILVTDGDEYAKKTIEYAAAVVGGRCISRSHGNPTELAGEEMVQLIMEARDEPVFVMFDDCGYYGEGPGEKAMKEVAGHPGIDVLGVIAVASRPRYTEWTRVDVSIDKYGNPTANGIDKSGIPEMEEGRINGDTVDCVDGLDAGVVVGIGDIGKMGGHDDVKFGAPVTMAAVRMILERSGFDGNKNEQ
ncbi:stage V sporulation protein AE [Bacillus marinisedimentorum]|uniref:stage V sporulation protein AE n=1 Tax=Bacillus marinisedimentorum TaxID=1821260 RepID=UPI000871FA4E|nr:stage V sporulation protein AE [Bacillus marinisedimentorum]